MSANVFFQNIEKILSDFSLKSSGCKSSPFIPEQILCDSEQELMLQCVSFLKNEGKKKIVLITDGVFKKASLQNPTQNFDDVIRALFQKTFPQSTLETFNLPKLLGVKPQDLHASLQFVDRSIPLIPSSEDTLFCVLGSGSITDIIKHALFKKNGTAANLVSFPTALTVTAFTSCFSVLEHAGVKRTYPSRIPDKVIWYTPVLQAAPIEFTRAGYGDLLARFVSFADYYLSHELGLNQNFQTLSYEIMEPFSDPLKKCASSLYSADKLSKECLRTISAALGMAGIAMTVSKETSPLSGFEHATSHALDYLRLTSHRPLLLHGEQVALCSLTSSQLFEILLEKKELPFSEFEFLTERAVTRVIHRLVDNAPFFGDEERNFSEAQRTEKLASLKEIIESSKSQFVKEYLEKNEAWHQHKTKVEELCKNWSEVKTKLKSYLISSQEMELLLKQAKLPLIPEDTTPPLHALEYRWAVRFSPFVRKRFCVADLFFWMGEDPVFF